MNLEEHQEQVYSQFTEDGITKELVQRLKPNPFFIEIGAGNGQENCTRVLLDLGWQGVWIDADVENVKAMPADWSRTVEQVYDRVDISNCFWMRRYPKYYVGLLSIDIDGNDYHLWKALCEYGGLQPAIVIIEAQIQRPFDEPYIMPYDPEYRWNHSDNVCGASVLSLKELGSSLGYSLVGKCPHPHSPNLFFVRTDLMEKL